MAIILEAGQEMKITIKSAGSEGNKNKTIRFLNPMATNTTDQNVTRLAKDLMASSKDSYISTSGSIELGILEEA